MQQLAASSEIDFHSDTYKDAYSRINAIVIEGEQEAHENYIRLAELLPEQKDDLIRLSKMESRHKKGFEACGRNLQVTPDMEFAREFFAQLHQNFQKAAESGGVVGLRESGCATAGGNWCAAAAGRRLAHLLCASWCHTRT